MTYGPNQIVLSALISIYNGGGNCRDWYAGITNNPERRLFSDHRVDRSDGHWFCWPVDSAYIAENVEHSLLNGLGFDGGTGGADRTARFVYIFKKTPHTRN